MLRWQYPALTGQTLPPPQNLDWLVQQPGPVRAKVACIALLAACCTQPVDPVISIGWAVQQATPVRAAPPATPGWFCEPVKRAPLRAGLPWVRTDPPTLEFRGAVTGLRVIDAAGHNGAGAGRLRIGGDGLAAWRPPGQTTFGTGVDVSAGGNFTLKGVAPGDSIDVAVTPAALPEYAEEADIHLSWPNANAVAYKDITPPQAWAGNVATLSVELISGKQDDAVTVSLWLDILTARYFELSADGSTWVRPVSAADALELTLPAAGSVILHLRRTIPAGCPAAPARPVRIPFLADDGVSQEEGMLGGWFRIFNYAVYRFRHRTDGRDPDPIIDAPEAEQFALVWLSGVLAVSSDHRFAVSRYNGVRESPLGLVRQVVLDAEGLETAAPPSPATLPALVTLSAGVLRLIALYAADADLPAVRATHAAIWWRMGANPVFSGDPDAVVALQLGRGYAVIIYDMPAQADGVLVTVQVRPRRSVAGQPTVDAATALEIATEAVADGPAAPILAGRDAGL